MLGSEHERWNVDSPSFRPVPASKISQTTSFSTKPLKLTASPGPTSSAVPITGLSSFPAWATTSTGKEGAQIIVRPIRSLASLHTKGGGGGATPHIVSSPAGPGIVQTSVPPEPPMPSSVQSFRKPL
jgi:hypothetical protein